MQGDMSDMRHSYYTPRLLAVLVSAGMLASAAVHAEDLSNVKEEIEDMKAKVAALENRAAPPAAGDAQSLTALQKKGAIRIGGDVNVDLIVKRRDDGTPEREGDTVNSTAFHTNSANLRFKIDASPDMYLYIKLDLDDSWDATANQDDLLEECKFVWNHIRESNWGLVFGKGEVPYGQDKTLGAIQSYHHNADQVDGEGPIILTGATEENGEADAANPYLNRGYLNRRRAWHPGEVDNVFLLEANYSYKDLARFEIAVFQNNDTTGGGRLTRGMHEDRPDDHLGFESFAARLWIAPMEALRFEFSFIKMHTDSFGDKGQFGRFAEDDRYAVNAGFYYKFANAPLEAFGEYQHGWDWAYQEDYDTDTAQLGLVWNVTQPVDVWVVGEWLGIDDDAWNVDEDYWKVVVGARYRFENGIYLVLEYGHEWWDGDYDNARDLDGDADVVVFRSGWAF